MSELLARGAEKSFRVRQMFNKIAKDYDILNRWLSFGLDQYWRRRTIQSVRVGQGDIVVDLACGTGDLCKLASQAGASVLGLDFSRNMLVRAAKKQTPAVLVEGDDTDEPIADATRGILDGHIMLSRNLAAKNHYPCIEIGHSVSRLFPIITTKDHQQAVGRLREILARYYEAEDLIINARNIVFK